MRNRWLAGPGLAAVAVIALAACGSSGGSSASSGGGASAPAAGSGSSAAGGGGGGGSVSTVVKTVSSSAGKVLANSKGFTLYTFAKDQGSTSKCYGACAKFWPPAMGPATVAPGAKVSGTFGVTTRKNGSKQLTYNGKPLYTFAGDHKPGDVNGNGSTADGGLWKVIVTSAAAAPAPAASSSSSSGSGSGGYGY